MEWLWIIAIVIVTNVPLIVFFALIPYLTRRTESFGISIPEEFYNEPELQNLRKTYRNQVLIINVFIVIALISLSLLVRDRNTPMVIFGLGLVTQLIVMFYLYLRGHRNMKKIKAEKHWTVKNAQVVVVDTQFAHKKITVSPWWFSLYLPVILATLGLGIYFYPGMPERVPIHFNFAGRPDGWANKSFGLLFYMPVAQTFLLFLMLFVHWVIRKAKQQVDANNADKSIEQNRVFRHRWSLFSTFTGLVLVIQLGIAQISMLGLLNPLVYAPIFIGITIGIVIAALILAITTGQGGNRIKIGKTKTGETINRDDDKYWKLGIFYYNPEDPAVFVEKRFGIGWTSNMARPLSWVILSGLIVLIAVMTVAPLLLQG